MTELVVDVRAAAATDIADAVDHYWREAGEARALLFLAALERVFERIGRHPSSGSPRYAHELGWPGLRAAHVPRHPYLVFYVERAGVLDAIRVLHQHQHLPAWLSEGTE